MVDIRYTGYAKLDRLRRIMEAARDTNPYQRAAMSAPPTITVSTSTDGTLAPRTDLANGSGVTAAALNQVAWYGGVPTAKSSAYVAMPVASVLPSTSGNAGLPSTDLNSWQFANEIMTDAATVEFCNFMHSGRKVMYQIDGQYVDFTGVAGTAASNADNFVKLAFGARKVRRIRQLCSTHPSNGVTYPKSLRCDALSTFWKPPQSDVVRVGWSGDSMSEGFNTSATIYPIPNAAWPVAACEILGFRDCRQLAVGSCGYISDNGAARSKLRDQMPRWANQAPFDLFVFANGYNDASNSAAAITAEVLYDLQLCRATYPGIPIVVLGCQAGAGGPAALQITCEGAINAAVTAFNDPLCKFAPVSTDAPPWYSGTGKVGATTGAGNSDIYVDTDGAHDSLAGSDYKALRSAAAIRTAITSMLA
jgi:hypothetical protein